MITLLSAGCSFRVSPGWSGRGAAPARRRAGRGVAPRGCCAGAEP